ncbi:hypothetical protein CKO28_09070 [Rhodovibrio sodomensis]|uniref:Uncharacterized protein n=1 Tax=Rhodovibrio sodomensis TaxID=1088 RepID=A0ABS1DCK6_9PROT|nr:hypothetical protein [Rhodovibrio sodomensis]MBK1668187.1 hypothetical protein [Rhodovibrio sodomensis]
MLKARETTMREIAPLLGIASCALLGLQAFLGQAVGGGLFGDALLGPDSYARGARVLDLLQGGGWFEPALDRVVPGGVEQHWSRAMDLLIAMGTLLFWPFSIDLQSAIVGWSTVLPPVLHVALLWAAVWAVSPVFDRQRLLYLTLILVAQIYIAPQFAPGRIDWHSLVLITSVVTLGFLLRLLSRDGERVGAAIGLGAVFAAGIWISPETMLTLAPTVGVIGLAWCLHTRRMGARDGLTLSGVALAGLVALHLLDHGTLWSVPTVDRISGLYLGLFAAHFGFWMLARLTERHVSRGGVPLARLAIAGVCALTVVLGLYEAFPALASGRINEVDDLYHDLRVAHIQELDGVFSFSHLLSRGVLETLTGALPKLSLFLLALPLLAWRLLAARGLGAWLWGWLALCFAILLRDDFVPNRMLAIFALLSAYPVAEALGKLLDELDRRAVVSAVRRAMAGNVPAGGAGWESLMSPQWRRSTVVATLLVAILFALPFAGRPFAADTGPHRYRLPEMNETLVGKVERPARPAGCGHDRVIDLLPAGSRTVMTYADLGPQILFRTEHKVLSIPTHRPQPGFAASHLAMSAERAEAARDILTDLGVDLVLICDSPGVRAFFALDDRSSVGSRLLAGADLPGFGQVALPRWARQAGLALVRVEKARASGGRDGF